MAPQRIATGSSWASFFIFIFQGTSSCNWLITKCNEKIWVPLPTSRCIPPAISCPPILTLFSTSLLYFFPYTCINLSPVASSTGAVWIIIPQDRHTICPFVGHLCHSDHTSGLWEGAPSPPCQSCSRWLLLLDCNNICSVLKYCSLSTASPACFHWWRTGFAKSKAEGNPDRQQDANIWLISALLSNPRIQTAGARPSKSQSWHSPRIYS